MLFLPGVSPCSSSLLSPCSLLFLPRCPLSISTLRASLGPTAPPPPSASPLTQTGLAAVRSHPWALLGGVAEAREPLTLLPAGPARGTRPSLHRFLHVDKGSRSCLLYKMKSPFPFTPSPGRGCTGLAPPLPCRFVTPHRATARVALSS